MNILSAVAGIAGNWVSGKVEESKAKSTARVEKAKADAAVQKKIATGKVDWESQMANASKDSWKDEYLVVVLTLPAILVFVPSLTQHVREGFAVLETLPQWYQYLLFIAVTSSFGVRGANKLMSMRGKK